MKRSKYWLSTLAAMLGCALGNSSFGDETSDAVYGQPVFRQALVQQQVPTSRWDAQEPVETPEQDFASVPGSTCVCAESCEFGLQLIAGVESTFLWPQLSRTFLQTAFNNGLGPVDIVNNTALGSADGSMIAGPRLTLGVQGECWGLVGRYWNATTWGTGFIPSLPSATQSGVILSDTFRAYTLDLEVQRRFTWRNWDCFGFFGVRYGSVNNDRDLWIQNNFGSEIVEAMAYAGQQYNGTGVTFGFFGLRPLFCDGGALKAYFTNRYSVLWGNGVAVVETSAMAQDANFFVQSTDGALARGDGDLFIVEVGFGLQWESCLQCLPGRAFLRTGLEWQYWDTNTGVSAGSLSLVQIQTTGTGAGATTDAGELLFDMVGFTIGAGITY